MFTSATLVAAAALARTAAPPDLAKLPGAVLLLQVIALKIAGNAHLTRWLQMAKLQLTRLFFSILVSLYQSMTPLRDN